MSAQSGRSTLPRSARIRSRSAFARVFRERCRVSDARITLYAVLGDTDSTAGDSPARLGISDRHARRLAPKLGGKKNAGCWFVDEVALAQHIEGRQ